MTLPAPKDVAREVALTKARELVASIRRVLNDGDFEMTWHEAEEVVASALHTERDKAVEECAKVAEERSAQLPHDTDFTRGYTEGRRAAASDILALRVTC